MSRNRKRTRHYVDIGNGVTFATTTRGPLDDKTRDALTELARVAVARHLDVHVLPRVSQESEAVAAPNLLRRASSAGSEVLSPREGKAS